MVSLPLIGQLLNSSVLIGPFWRSICFSFLFRMWNLWRNNATLFLLLLFCFLLESTALWDFITWDRYKTHMKVFEYYLLRAWQPQRFYGSRYTKENVDSDKTYRMFPLLSLICLLSHIEQMLYYSHLLLRYSCLNLITFALSNFSCESVACLNAYSSVLSMEKNELIAANFAHRLTGTWNCNKN